MRPSPPARIPGAGRGDDDELAASDWAEFDAIDPQTSDEQVMLNREALLATHETGHTLGLEHNFIASRYGRGSVMDYFAPRIKIRPDGSADMSDAWMQGVGSYDKFAIEWGYSQGRPNATPEQERARLDAIVKREAIDAKHVWGSAQDPRWVAYDDGPDPIAALGDIYKVRTALLKNFNQNMLRPGEPWSDLGNLFPLVYMFHQYEINAVVDMVGGAEIPPALKGDGQTPITVYSGDLQRRALAELMQALDPQQLEVRQDLWQILAPFDGPGFGGDPERFRSSAGYLFSPEDGVRAVCELIFGGLLEPTRLQRVIAINREDPNAIKPADLISTLVNAAFRQRATADDRGGSVLDIIQIELAERMMILAAEQDASAEVRALAWWALPQIEALLTDSRRGASSTTTQLLKIEIENFRRDPKNNVPRLKPSGAPPGPPI